MTNGMKDSNGNEVPSVSDLRKRFDQKMTVTKLPVNEPKYGTKAVELYLSQLKECENGIGYTKVVQDEKPVPVHLPYERNGTSKWDGSGSSRSNSNSDLSISKTISEPVSLAKPLIEKNNTMSTSLTSKLPSDRLASIKSQLDPNNPIGKILEKSTVIQVENGEVTKKSSRDISKKETLKNDIEKQVKTPKHTSNFASYIQISQPISSKHNGEERNDKTERDKSEKDRNEKLERKKVNLKYIDTEDSLVLDNNDIESPSGTGFENKTFEHENFLKKRTEHREIEENQEDGAKSMETSTESTLSEEDSSPDTPFSRRKVLDDKEMEDIKAVSNAAFLQNREGLFDAKK